MRGFLPTMSSTVMPPGAAASAVSVFLFLLPFGGIAPGQRRWARGVWVGLGLSLPTTEAGGVRAGLGPLPPDGERAQLLLEHEEFEEAAVLTDKLRELRPRSPVTT